MKSRSLGYFCCAVCRKRDLRYCGSRSSGQTDGWIDGSLACTGCGARFPIQNAIPRFVPAENYAISFGYQWNLHTRTQLDSFTGLPISRKRVFSASRWPERLEGQTILEAGSGAGRFTEILIQTGAELFSFDYSSAVDANAANNGGKENLHLFQADIFRIPLPNSSFDKVLCLGVLQHTPDPERAFKCLAEMVRPEGELVIDIYSKTLVSVMRWKYLLRPITVRIPQKVLYKAISSIVPFLIPVSRILRRLAGRFGARLLPIIEYSHLGLSPELNRQWAILDTFDMYSPIHDHPRSISTVRKWFDEVGFESVSVDYGPNGIVARGCRPK